MTDKNKIVYWKYAVIVILVYTLNIGLRWGRGTDYNLYYYNYNDVIRNKSADSIEPLWRILIQLSGFWGLSWCDFVVFMSLCLILAGVYFMQYHRSVLIFAFPLFVFSVEMAENLMRWYLGFSFILIGLIFLNNKRIYVYILLSALGFLIHYGLIVNILGFLILSFVRKPIYPLYSLIILFSFFFFFSSDHMANYTDFIQNIDIGERFIYYQQNAEYWLTGEALRDELFMSLTSLVTSVFMIVYGYQLIKKRIDLVFFYNIAVIGAITAPAMMRIELALRMNLLFYLFQFLILAYIFKDVFFISKRRFTYRYICTFVILLNIIRVIILKPLVLEPNKVLYIWDAAGRHTLF